MIYSPGLKVSYQQFTGVIHFVCDSYVTLDIDKPKHIVNSVLIVVHRNRYSQIKLLKESDK